MCWLCWLCSFVCLKLCRMLLLQVNGMCLEISETHETLVLVAAMGTLFHKKELYLREKA